MKENSIKEDIERLELCSTNQCYICGRYEKEECMLERTRYELYKYYKELAGSYQGNCIPVQKVKDKIEEYKKMLLSCNRFSDVDRIKAINERILELQELLESEEK